MCYWKGLLDDPTLHAVSHSPSRRPAGSAGCACAEGHTRILAYLRFSLHPTYHPVPSAVPSILCSTGRAMSLLSNRAHDTSVLPKIMPVSLGDVAEQVQSAWPIARAPLLLPTWRTPRERREIPNRLARCRSLCPVPRAVWRMQIDANTLWVSHLVVLADTCTLAWTTAASPSRYPDAFGCPGHPRRFGRRPRHAATPSTLTCLARWSPSREPSSSRRAAHAGTRGFGQSYALTHGDAQ